MKNRPLTRPITITDHLGLWRDPVGKGNIQHTGCIREGNIADFELAYIDMCFARETQIKGPMWPAIAVRGLRWKLSFGNNAYFRLFLSFWSGLPPTSNHRDFSASSFQILIGLSGINSICIFKMICNVLQCEPYNSFHIIFFQVAVGKLMKPTDSKILGQWKANAKKRFWKKQIVIF